MEEVGSSYFKVSSESKTITMILFYNRLRLKLVYINKFFVIVSNPESELGEPNSNSTWVWSIHFCTNNFGEGMNSSLVSNRLSCGPDWDL